MNTSDQNDHVYCYCRVNTDNRGGNSNSVGDVERHRRSNVEQHVATEASHAVQDNRPSFAPVQPLPAANFNHLRLVATYAWLPRSVATATRPLPLARDGFFYIGRRRVCCYHCGIEVPLLGGHGSSPQQQHGVLSPNCQPGGQAVSEAMVRDVLFWMPRCIEIRRQGVTPHDLNINWR